jgi:hypothetical protein
VPEIKIKVNLLIFIVIKLSGDFIENLSFYKNKGEWLKKPINNTYN